MNANHANPNHLNREPRQRPVRFAVVWFTAGALPVLVVAGAYRAGWTARGHVDTHKRLTRRAR